MQTDARNNVVPLAVAIVVNPLSDRGEATDGSKVSQTPIDGAAAAPPRSVQRAESGLQADSVRKGRSRHSPGAESVGRMAC
jgi:hypothetical protein